MKKLTIIIILFSAMALAVDMPTTGERKKQPQGPNTYVLIVSGICKDAQENKAKDEAVKKLFKFFILDAKLPHERLTVLAERTALENANAQLSTAENLKKAIRSIAASIKPADRFVFYYCGQANVAGGKLRMNLPGKDVTHNQLAGYLKQIKASSMLIVLDCPAAGTALKALAGPKRIVICASTNEQPYSTSLSKYFVPALTDLSGDKDSNGRISILEAFTMACEKQNSAYRKKGLIKTETPLLEDNGDSVPSLQPGKNKKNKDGFFSSNYFLCQ